MKFNITQKENITFFEIPSKKLDTKLAPDLKSQFIILANEPATGHLVVDLGNITFVDSSGLSSLLMAYRLFRETDRSFIICNLSMRVAKLIEISQLTSVFTIAIDQAQAVSLIE